MKYGNLTFSPITSATEVIGATTKQYILDNNLEVQVAEIDPTLSDTAAFCEKYEVGLDASANCVIVQAKRGERVWYAAIVVLATTRADINGIVRKELDAKKVSFAPMETAVELTDMEFGAINPIGLPADWPILVDEQVALCQQAIIGSGLRNSKLLVSGDILATLPGAKVLNLVKTD